MDNAEQARSWHRRGDLERALAAYRRALQLSPNGPAIWHDYGVALLQSRRPADAVAALQHAARISPDHFDIQLALSQAYQVSGRIEDALACASAATALQPAMPLGWLLRGRQETILGAFDPAESSLRNALRLDPALDEAWHYLGEVLQRRRLWDEAAQAYTFAMRTQPGEIMNIAVCLERAGRWQAARDAYQNMCALHPERRDCLVRLAQVAAMLCDFKTEACAVARLEALMAGGSAASSRPDDCPEPFVLAYLPVPLALRRQALQDYVRRISRHVVALPARDVATGGRKKIGYISADFGRHAVGTLLEGMFAAHDRARFEVVGYSLRRHDDDTADTLSREFDMFRDMEGTPSLDVAKRIRDDGIDVLIDLGGFTGGARPEILAMRPAPVQLGWLGFIHAHEAPWLDGVILDDHIQPPTEAWAFSDTVLRLPGLALPCGPMPSGIADRHRFGLPEDVPLFASFNNSYKLDEELVAAWIEILRRADCAHLVLYLKPEAHARFVDNWQQRGGDRERLHLVGHLPPDAQADRAASCDLFLDAFRYQAGATALASVAAGLPILSRRGATPLARLSVGVNQFLGLDTLVCRDTAHYIDRAVELGTDRIRLASLKDQMHQAAARMRLFDPRRSAEGVELLIEHLNERAPRSGLPR